jgi:hypothetical protein
MAIQFRCSACHDPIEIDPEWGGKAVVCPYCRNTVTAPVESTYQPPSEAPVARRAPDSGAIDVVSDAPAWPASPAERNRAAVWALVLSISTLACWITMQVVAAEHIDELEPFARMKEEGRTYAEVNEAVLKHFGYSPPRWLVGLAILTFMALGLWLASIICGLVGVSRRPRRNLAIAALALSIMLAVLPVLSG